MADSTMHNIPHWDCSQVAPLLSDYLDNQLQAASVPPIKQHIGGCETCADLLKGMLRVRDHAHDWSEATTYSSLWKTIQEQLQTDAEQTIPCSFDLETWSTYIDGRDEDSLAFEQHLSGCQPCSEGVGLLLETTDACRSYMLRLEACCDIDLTQKVLSTFQTRRVIRPWVWASSVAASIACFFFISSLWNHPGSATETIALVPTSEDYIYQLASETISPENFKAVIHEEDGPS